MGAGAHQLAVHRAALVEAVGVVLHRAPNGHCVHRRAAFAFLHGGNAARRVVGRPLEPQLLILPSRQRRVAAAGILAVVGLDGPCVID